MAKLKFQFFSTSFNNYICKNIVAAYTHSQKWKIHTDIKDYAKNWLTS